MGQSCNASGACAPTANSENPARVFTNLQVMTRRDAFFNFDISNAGGNEFIGSGQLDGQGVPPNFFSDLHVRKAFNYCFDWAAYIAEAMQGEGTQSLDVMLPGEIGYRDTDPVYSHDPAKCRSEFQASSLKSTDGRSLWDTGFRLTLVTSADNLYRQAVAQILSRNISQINPKFVV